MPELDPYYLKRKWSIFEFFPSIISNASLAIYPRIFMVGRVYDRLMKGNYDAYDEAHFNHEMTHIERQKEAGVRLWYSMYLLSPEFRYNEELIAIEQEWRTLHEAKQEPDIKHKAKTLSGPLYAWQVNLGQATTDLEKLWLEICTKI